MSKTSAGGFYKNVGSSSTTIGSSNANGHNNKQTKSFVG